MSKDKAPKANELLGISQDYKVKRYRHMGGHIVAHITREPRNRQCARCGIKGHIKGRHWRKVWHTPIRGVPLMLMVEIVRFQCPTCKKTWSDTHEIVSDASIHMTKDVADAVLIDLMDKMSVAATSDKQGPSCHMVNCVLDQAIIDGHYLPRVLCIDEFKANSDEGKMAVCVADGDAGVLIEILPRLTTRCIDDFFDEFDAKERARVAYYCCDMSRMFIAAKKKWFSQAILCIDRFHVVKLITTAFNDVRRRVQNDEDIPVSMRKEIKGSWKLFLCRRVDLEQADIGYAARLADQRISIAETLELDDEEIADLGFLKPREPRLARVDRLLALDSDLRCAYKLLHLFRDWSDMAWCADKRNSLANWIALATRSNIPEMKRAARTLKTNREGVLNGYHYNKTNATAEGLNNSIKVMKRMSYGFRSFKRMRRRCLLSLGYYRIIKRGIKLNGVKTDLE